MTRSLNGLVANAVQTAPSGVVNAETRFTFRQEGARVWAEYSGGRIARGFLVGLREGDRLTFRYCQLQTDGTLDGGESHCELGESAEGLIQIIERFAWASRPGTGENVIQQLP